MNSAADSPAHQKFRACRDFLLEHRSDHDEAYRNFRWPELTTFNWARDWFDIVAHDNHRTALRVIGPASDVSMSFDSLARGSDQVAAWLHELGIRRRDVVLVLLDNRPELWEVMLAVMKLGAVVLPTYTTATTPELAERVLRAQARHLIVESSLTDLIPHGLGCSAMISVGPPTDGWESYDNSHECSGNLPDLAPTRADDPLFYYFTSGTTSRPKLVCHTQVSYPVGHLSSMYWNGVQPGDVHCNVAAPGWAKHAWSSLFVPWNAEATLVALAGAASPDRVLEALERTQATTFCAPPSMWRALVRNGLDCRNIRLREATSAGEALPQEVVSAVSTSWGVTVRNGYGQTETTAQLGVTPGSVAAPTSLGRPLPGYRMALCPPGSDEPALEGEVCVDLAEPPVGLMSGYLDDPAATVATAGSRYYRTGDLAQWRAGELLYLGRIDDVFKAADHRISPAELEGVLGAHAAVAEAAIVPAPDSAGGLKVKAYVVLDAGWNGTAATAVSVFDHLQARLPREKHVGCIEFVDALPRTSSGKIRRGALQDSLDAAGVEFVPPQR